MYTLPSNVGPRVADALQMLKRCGAVVEPCEGNFQMTIKGFRSLQHVRKTVEYNRVLVPRQVALELKDRIHWELMCMLDQLGWNFVPFHGQRLQPLDLKKLQAANKNVFVNKRMLDVGHAYLECLCDIPGLVSRGVCLVK